MTQKAYKDPDLLRELYVEKKLSTSKIADRLDCAPNTVRKYLKGNGIEIRSQSEAMSYAHGNHPNEVPLNIHGIGYKRWNHTYKTKEKCGVFVHQLLAIAEYGFDAVVENSVHHVNGIPWDNRPDNLELVDHDTHMKKHHRKVEGIDRLRIAELYENGNASSYTIADQVEHDITPSTVRAIHEEMFGDAA